jgi:hypothetical protein
MGKFSKALMLIIIGIFLNAVHVNAYDITEINALIEDSKLYDKKEITIKAEAIGEEMNRGEYSWVNVNDGTNAIGVWMRNEDAAIITYYGNYDYKGDILRIKGTFNRACNIHGGEADIHCTDISVVEKGHYVSKEVPKVKIIIAVILTIIAICFYYVYKRAKKYKSK